MPSVAHQLNSELGALLHRLPVPLVTVDPLDHSLPRLLLVAAVRAPGPPTEHLVPDNAHLLDPPLGVLLVRIDGVILVRDGGLLLERG